jgi:ferredoxin
MSDTSKIEETTAELKPAMKKGPRGQVTVFANWCKGCGICVAFCPTGVLALDDDDGVFRKMYCLPLVRHTLPRPGDHRQEA